MNIDIEKKAQKILKVYNADQVPVPVEKIAKDLDIIISYAASDKYSGMLHRKADKVILMGLNNLESFNRQRFTMAHELGHYFLHVPKNTFIDDKVTIDYRDNKFGNSDNQKEREANAFAAALLMPRENVERDFKIILKKKRIFIDDHLTTLASKYEVSRDAMKYRLINLGFIRI